MKISKLFKKIIKTDGKHSMIAKKINQLRSSKEFKYLVDSGRA